MMRQEKEKRLALAISIGFHAVVFGIFAMGGLFSFLQSHSQPPPVDVTVYNEEAVHESDAPGSSAPDGGGGGGETYAAPTTAMPEINESYTQAAQTERAVEKVMQEQHVDAATAKQVVAAKTAQPNATSSQGSNTNATNATASNSSQSAGSGNGVTVGPGTNPDAASGNGNGTGPGNSNGNGNGDGKRPAKKARLISYPDTEAYYPESLRRKNISATVQLHVVISADGAVTSATVISSSGYSEMDEAAVRLAYQFRYEPAENEDGQPVTAERTINVPFGVH